MKIKEASEVLGISISNIRFYEKKGLIGPERDKDSKYRNYNDADIEDIKNIIVLRKMGVSIETISQVQQGEIDLREALKSQISLLNEEEERIIASKNLCQKAVEEEYDNMSDMISLYNYVGEEEKHGVSYIAMDEVVESIAGIFSIDNFILSLPFGIYIYSHPFIRGILRVLILLWVMLFPLVFLVIGLMDSKQTSRSIAIILFLGLWETVVLYHFVKGFLNIRKCE